VKDFLSGDICGSNGVIINPETNRQPPLFPVSHYQDFSKSDLARLFRCQFARDKFSVPGLWSLYNSMAKYFGLEQKSWF
jgi:hypothetical protein